MGRGRRRLGNRFERVWRDGSTAVDLEPFDLIARICAVIPKRSLPSGEAKHRVVRRGGVLIGDELDDRVGKAKADIVVGRSRRCRPVLCRIPASCT